MSEKQIDERGVDNFAQAMKAKLAVKRKAGRGGWHDPDQCDPERLAEMLLDHLSKGDPVDVGNFAMMLHNRIDGQGVLAAVYPTWLEAQTRLERNNWKKATDEQAERAIRAEATAKEAQRIQAKEAEHHAKELEHLRDRLRRAETNLTRALGYIDRVTEGEPPLPGFHEETHERVGPVAVSRIRGAARRGPQLDCAEPSYDHEMNYGWNKGRDY